MTIYNHLPILASHDLSAILFILLVALQGEMCNCQAAETTADQSERISVNEILNVWKKRESSAKSLSAKWEIDRSEDNRWSTYQTDTWAVSRKDSLSVIDQQSLIIRGHKIRYEHPRWHLHAQSEYADYPKKLESGPSGKRNYLMFRLMLEKHFDASYPQLQSPHQLLRLQDEEKWIDYYQKTGKGISFAKISTPSSLNLEEHTWVESSIFRPILLLYRQNYLNAEPIKEKDLNILNTNSMFDGRECLVLEYPIHEQLKARCWVDTKRDYLILRNLLIRGEQTMEQVDITYKQNKTSQWIPDRWTVILKSQNLDFPGRRSTFQFVSCKLLEMTLNPHMPDNHFQVQFLPGTYVFDSINKTNYLIQPDQSTKKLNASEIAQLDLMGSGLNQQSGSAWYWRKDLGLALIFFVLYMIYFNRHRLTKRAAITGLSQEKIS